MSTPEQPSIPNLEPPERTEAFSPMPELVANERRIAFGRVVMPYFFNLKEKDYQDITPAHIAAADPRRFLPYLLPAQRFTESEREQKQIVDGVALPPEEFERIVRSPKAFADKAGSQTLKSRALDPVLERRNDAARRAEIHSLSSKQPQMEKTLKGIQNEQRLVKILAAKAHHPGYAHYRAGELLSWAAYVHEVTFDRILNVVGIQKDWTSEQAELARRSLDYRLFFTARERVGNWRQMLRVAEAYGSQRERLFKDRIRRVGNMLTGLAADEAEE